MHGETLVHPPARVAEDAAKGIKRRLLEELMVEAPPDLEAVNAQITQMPRWMSALLLAGSCAGSWAAILVVAHLLR